MFIDKEQIMSNYYSILLLPVILTFVSCKAQENKSTNMEKKTYNSLTPSEERVILKKGTDMPFTGDYYNKKDSGIYICKQCNAPLYESTNKFDSYCGWPSFDDEIKGAVERVTDADGQRTEIICSNCKGHLGHVFLGEGFTDKNTRHCVNTSSLLFIPMEEKNKIPPMIVVDN